MGEKTKVLLLGVQKNQELDLTHSGTSPVENSGSKTYQFQYDSSDSGRFEKADESGNIHGKVSKIK